MGGVCYKGAGLPMPTVGYLPGVPISSYPGAVGYTMTATSGPASSFVALLQVTMGPMDGHPRSPRSPRRSPTAPAVPDSTGEHGPKRGQR